MKIVQKFITRDDSYNKNLNAVELAQRDGDYRYLDFQKRGPIKLMLHSVGTPQPSAEVFATRWNNPGREASVHAVLQADGLVIQTMPWNFRAWHAGGSDNNTHVGVEMCEPNTIRYYSGSKFTILDYNDSKGYVMGCYKTAVELFAKLCIQYKLNPLKDIDSHAEGYKKGIASNHGDPEHLWRGLDLSYTMDGFRRDVKAKIEEMEDDMTQAETQKLIEQNIAKIKFPAPTRDQIMKALGDTWIETYKDLPNWAKEEVMELIKLGAIKGKKPVSNPEDTVIQASLDSYIRPAIVAYRLVKPMIGDYTDEALREKIAAIMSAFQRDPEE